MILAAASLSMKSTDTAILLKEGIALLSSGQRLTEVHAREERKQRQEKEVRAQRQEQELRDFQRAHGPETPRPSKIRLRIGTLVSALSAGSP